MSQVRRAQGSSAAVQTVSRRPEPTRSAPICGDSNTGWQHRGRAAVTTIRDIRLPCGVCGKTLSYEQMILWPGRQFCLDCTISMLTNDRIVMKPDRVSVSVDLLSRLRDGVL